MPGAQNEAFKGVSVLVGLMVSIGAFQHRGAGGEWPYPCVGALTTQRRIRIGDSEN
jgi:hypothetical protein